MSQAYFDLISKNINFMVLAEIVMKALVNKYTKLYKSVFMEVGGWLTRNNSQSPLKPHLILEKEQKDMLGMKY